MTLGRGVPILLCLSYLSWFVGTGEAQSKPILINCGSNSTVRADGRTWVGDLVAGNNLTLSSPGFNASVAAPNGDLVLGSLYQTVRIFNTTANFTFNVSAGSYYIRFHFHPFSAEGFNANDSDFDVAANNLKLLSRYNVTAEIARKDSYLQSLGSNSTITTLIKEYFLTINSDMLWVQFIPSSRSFAYVNAIEVLPVLDNSFFNSVTKVGGASSSLSLGDRGMETMYRVNMGDRGVEPNQDQELWRSWETDTKYMFHGSTASKLTNDSSISYADGNHSSAAPLLVYVDARTMPDNLAVEKKLNMTWTFSVDPNFDYLVRLHFCELLYDRASQRVFRIYINLRTAANNYDVFLRAGGKGKAYCQDFVDTVSEQVDTLLLQLGQDTSTSASNTDAILNGLEIFKLSRNGNLAHFSDKINSGGGGFQGKGLKGKSLWIGISAGVASVVIISVVCLLIFFCICKKKASPVKSNPPGWHPLILHGTLGSTPNVPDANSHFNANGSAATTRTGRRFTIMEIRAATENFDESLVIGNGGFGKVYKGELGDGNLVAIKRAHPHSEQGLAEFETEIEMLSKLRHRHLVSLIGYCDEQKEMVLVYEYMANGTLRSHLYGSDLPALSWKQRLEACIGAARGLHYLHTGAERGIIHRDIKTTNILLDENLVAKMADFGLSKAGPMLDHTHVSTAVKGSFGYLDPEYFRRQQLTQKSDVYSFGVVLFEVVCARPVINPTLPKDQINLAEWAARWQQQGSLETIVDPRLHGSCSLESLKKFGEIALKCLAEQGKNRPTMGEVLWHLEYVLQLHEAHTRNFYVDSVPTSEVGSADMAFSLPLIEEGEENACPEIPGAKAPYAQTKSKGQCSKDASGGGESSVG
uniref:Putative receptor-like protein kinase At1g30570 n=1 Tax=Anthurium amnicola TaxID=1678845 RepID=A0A1D1YJV5_9ARAE